MTDFFQYRRGLKHGCLLSPILFALFLNDLQDNLFEKGTERVNLWNINICTYADDLVLIADNENDLHLQMNILANFANRYKMEITQKKTKIMIFDKNKIRPQMRHSKKLLIFSIILDNKDLFLKCWYKKQGNAFIPC